MYRLLRQNTTSSTDVYHVESESSDDHYYFVKFKQDVLEWYCSYKDNSTRHTIKCKHIFAIEFTIKRETIKDIEKLQPPLETNKIYPAVVQQSNNNNKKSSHLEDDYDF